MKPGGLILWTAVTLDDKVSEIDRLLLCVANTLVEEGSEFDKVAFWPLEEDALGTLSEVVKGASTPFGFA